jgi:hypothetical protein
MSSVFRVMNSPLELEEESIEELLEEYEELEDELDELLPKPSTSHLSPSLRMYRLDEPAP